MVRVFEYFPQITGNFKDLNIHFLKINLICSDMHLKCSYVLKHNLSHLIQFFGIVCMNQNEDTNIFNFHEIHELGFFPCF